MSNAFETIDDYKKMLSENIFSDFTLIIDGLEFAVNKNILVGKYKAA